MGKVGKAPTVNSLVVYKNAPTGATASGVTQRGRESHGKKSEQNANTDPATEAYFINV